MKKPKIAKNFNNFITNRALKALIILRVLKTF